MNACQQHRKSHLNFKVNNPFNADIVNYFFDRIEKLPSGKFGVTVNVKHVAINQWGFCDAMAGMFRAFRKFRRINT